VQTHSSGQPTPADYHAGLLRLWRNGPHGPWRVSLQDVESGERLGFADLEQLFAYLRQLTCDAPNACDASTATER
jgi:hypothetical protein